MKTTMLLRRLASWQLAAALVIAGGALHSAQGAKPAYFTSLDNDSDIFGVAHDTDPLLVNPWGLTTGVEGNLHVADNATGVSTLYGPNGAILVSNTAAIVIPTAAVTTGTVGSPSGVDPNFAAILGETGTDDFPITSGTITKSSHYLYCTEDGAIAGYRSDVDKTTAIIPTGGDQSAAGAGYTGLALSWVGTSGSLQHQLYAANFRQGKIDVFDHNFVLQTGTGFVDSNPPPVPADAAGASWSPFNIHRVDFKNGKDTVRLLLVAYALHDSLSMNDIPGTTGTSGHGYMAVYNSDGSVYTARPHLNFGTALNSPWGIAIAHGGFGDDLAAPLVIFVGNHGDGQIHAYALEKNPKYTDLDKDLGTVVNDERNPLAFDGLWALHFGPKKITLKEYLADPADLTEDIHNFYFSAGILGESHGLVGRIEIQTPSN
jgi:uncharacterized protein (TIGR03118 family)